VCGLEVGWYPRGRMGRLSRCREDKGDLPQARPGGEGNHPKEAEEPGARQHLVGVRKAKIKAAVSLRIGRTTR